MSDPSALPPVDRQTLQAWADAAPFIRYCRMQVECVDVGRGLVEMSMPITPSLSRDSAGTQLHGGPLASLIDTAGDFAVAIAVGAGVPTINFRVDYLRPATGTRVLARALARRVGRTVGVADVDVFDDQGRLVAIGRGCYSGRAG
jgi:uncharacterized protein (TIGR00369 family)